MYVYTNLAASVNIKQTHPTSQLLGIFDAVPQNAGGEIQGAFIRLRTYKHMHNFTSCYRGKCCHFYSYTNTSENKSAYSKHLGASAISYKAFAELLQCGVKNKQYQLIYPYSSKIIKYLPASIKQ